MNFCFCWRCNPLFYPKGQPCPDHMGRGERPRRLTANRRQRRDLALSEIDQQTKARPRLPPSLPTAKRRIAVPQHGVSPALLLLMATSQLLLLVALAGSHSSRSRFPTKTPSVQPEEEWRVASKAELVYCGWMHWFGFSGGHQATGGRCCWEVRVGRLSRCSQGPPLPRGDPPRPVLTAFTLSHSHDRRGQPCHATAGPCPGELIRGRQSGQTAQRDQRMKVDGPGSDRGTQDRSATL